MPVAYYLEYVAYLALYTCSSIDISVARGGRNDVTKHVGVKHHIEIVKAASSSRSMSSFFQPVTSNRVVGEK